MLVITRKVGDRVKIGDDITVTVLEVSGSSVRIGIDARATSGCTATRSSRRPKPRTAPPPLRPRTRCPTPRPPAPTQPDALRPRTAVLEKDARGEIWLAALAEEFRRQVQVGG